MVDKRMFEAHRSFREWYEKTPLPEALEEPAARLLNALWAAAHNPTPPPTMAEDVAAFEKARHT